MKKRKGSIPLGELLVLLLGLVAVMMVFSEFLSVCRGIAIKDEANQIARNYILEMETVGYLNAASSNSLRQELSLLGVTNVDLTGTTMADAGYGNRVYLRISFQIPTETLNTSGGDLMSFFFEDTQIPISIEKMSTAKR